jgi:hypothetical protein
MRGVAGASPEAAYAFADVIAAAAVNVDVIERALATAAAQPVTAREQYRMAIDLPLDRDDVRPVAGNCCNLPTGKGL